MRHLVSPAPVIGWTPTMGVAVRDGNHGNTAMAPTWLAMNLAQNLEEFQAVSIEVDIRLEVPIEQDHGIGPQPLAHFHGRLHVDGAGHLQLMTTMLTVAEGPNTVVGRAVILHEGEDDLVSQPTGAAGGRIACSVRFPDGVRLDSPGASLAPGETALLGRVRTDGETRSVYVTLF